jgi:hypothetical protein
MSHNKDHIYKIHTPAFMEHFSFKKNKFLFIITIFCGHFALSLRKGRTEFRRLYCVRCHTLSTACVRNLFPVTGPCVVCLWSSIKWQVNQWLGKDVRKRGLISDIMQEFPWTGKPHPVSVPRLELETSRLQSKTFGVLSPDNEFGRADNTSPSSQPRCFHGDATVPLPWP